MDLEFSQEQALMTSRTIIHYATLCYLVKQLEANTEKHYLHHLNHYLQCLTEQTNTREIRSNCICIFQEWKQEAKAHEWQEVSWRERYKRLGDFCRISKQLAVFSTIEWSNFVQDQEKQNELGHPTQLVNACAGSEGLLDHGLHVCCSVNIVVFCTILCSIDWWRPAKRLWTWGSLT